MIKSFLVILFLFNLMACQPVQDSQSENTQHKRTFSCLTSQSQCEVSTEFGKFTAQFAGQTQSGKINTEVPFHIQLTFVSNQDAYGLKRISSHLEGRDMFMGKIPVTFSMNGKTPTIYTAESLLASCANEVMTWRLWVNVDILVEGEVQQQSFFIDFDSQRL